MDEPCWWTAHADLEAVLRECLTKNVARHAHAEFVSIALTCTDDRLELLVSDDGVGVSTDRRTGGNGSGNMAVRVEYYGGTFRLAHRVSGGAIAIWSIPIPI